MVRRDSKFGQLIDEVVVQPFSDDGLYLPSRPYARLLKEYCRLMDFKISSRLLKDIEANREEIVVGLMNQAPPGPTVRSAIACICDGVRTTLMLKALAQAIDKKVEMRQNPSEPLFVVEAGFGTGIFIAAILEALGKDQNVKVVGIEKDLYCAQIALQLINHFDFFA